MMQVIGIWKVKGILKQDLLKDNKSKINILMSNNNKIVIMFLMLNFKILSIIKFANIILNLY